MNTIYVNNDRQEICQIWETVGFDNVSLKLCKFCKLAGFFLHINVQTHCDCSKYTNFLGSKRFRQRCHNLCKQASLPLSCM